MKSKQIKELSNLSKIKFEAKQKEYSAIARQEHALREKLRHLATNERIAQQASNDEFLQNAGAIFRWQKWIESTRANLNKELAQKLAQKERYRAELKNDFGTVEALRHLSDKLN